MPRRESVNKFLAQLRDDARRHDLLILFLVLTAVSYLGLSQASPHYIVGTGTYEVVVESRGEVSNLTVRISNYDFFNSTNDIIYRSTTDANYTLARQSGPVSGTNFTRADLSLVVRSQRANTVLFAAFPEMPVFLTDPNVNHTYWHEVTVTGNLSQVGQIWTRLTIRSTSGFLLYSFSRTAMVSGGRIDWATSYSEKNLQLFSSRLTALVGSMLLSGVVLAVFSPRSRRLVPYATLFFATIMMAVYWYWGTGNDILFNFEFTQVGRLVRLLSSPLLHASYGHASGNVFFGFLACGYLVECWMKNKIGFRAYGWFFSGYLLSLVFGVLGYVSGGISGVGASLWVIALASIILYYLVTRRIHLGRSELWPSLFAGYVIVSATYSYFANLIIYGYSEYSRQLDMGHLLFFGIAASFVMLVFWIRERFQVHGESLFHR